MSNRKNQFLVGVLGDDGARALQKAAERSEALGNALLPRTILSWVTMASRYEFEGALPGVSNSYLQFKKTEGPGFSGAISIGDDVFSFQNATLFHVAASVGVAIGCDAEPVDPDLRDLDLARLGKSIDVLARARVVAKEMEKIGGNRGENVHPDPDSESEKRSAAQIGKTELPGMTAKPRAQQGPQAPAQPQMQTAQPKPRPKLPMLKVAKSEMEAKCRMCGEPQFLGTRFRGCFCFASMAKSVKTTSTPEGLLLEFRGEWDRESIETLMGALRGQ